MEGFTIPWQPVMMAVVMMVLDVLSGFAGAAKTKSIESGKMREGLWHKAGYCGLIILAFAYEIATAWIDFEANAIGLELTIPDLPAVTAVCLFIVVTEVVSVLENLCELNPKIATLPFVKALRPHVADGELDAKVGGTE